MANLALSDGDLVTGRALYQRALVAFGELTRTARSHMRIRSDNAQSLTSKETTIA